MAYVATNPTIFAAAYSGAFAGMLASGRVLSSSNAADYTGIAAVAGAWAQQFDTTWASAANPGTAEVLDTYNQSYGVMEQRQPAVSNQTSTPSFWLSQVTAIIAAITAVLAYYAAQGTINPLWISVPGGSNLPNTGAVGTVLTTVTPGVPVTPTSVAFDAAGGFAISSFTGMGARELGNSDVSPTLTAAYNEAPDSASLSWANPPAGSPQALIAPYTSGQILQTFASNVVANKTVTLTAIRGATTKTATTTDAFGYGFLFNVDTVANIVATQGYLDTMRAAHTAQIHQTMTGTYGTGLSVGAGQQFAFAYPTALTLTQVKDINGFIITPGPVGTVAGYNNPFGVNVGMTLVTLGGIAIGSVSFAVS